MGRWSDQLTDSEKVLLVDVDVDAMCESAIKRLLVQAMQKAVVDPLMAQVSEANLTPQQISDLTTQLQSVVAGALQAAAEPPT